MPPSALSNEHLALCPYRLAVAKCQFAHCSVPNQRFIFEERMEFSRSMVGTWFALAVAAIVLVTCSGCDVQRRKSDAELGLNAQQAAGRRLYDQYCDRCHEPYSSRDKKGRSLQGVFKQQFLSQSGMPANDERVGEMIMTGRNMMPAFGQVMSQPQVQDLLAYLHTL
jgi:mono/diheme cytochrome c family protein